MTLHLSAIIRDAAYQVSDRLATRRGDVWEPEFNKNIVLRTPDALVSIGFAGHAYIDSKPVDEWAADVVWGEELGSDTLFTARSPDQLNGLSSLLGRVRAALNTHFSESIVTPDPDRVHVVVVGWRLRHRRLMPCLLTLSNAATGRLVTVLDRVRKRQRFGIVEADSPGWVALARLRRLNDALAQDLDYNERENLMIDVLRECANDGKPIGTDAMCIRIPRSEAKSTIRFEPAKMPARIFTRERDGKSQAMSVAYTPTIITPRAIQLPSLTTGVPFENLNGFEVDWKLPPLGPLAFDGTLLWINDRQPRRPNP